MRPAWCRYVLNSWVLDCSSSFLLHDIHDTLQNTAKKKRSGKSSEDFCSPTECTCFCTFLMCTSTVFFFLEFRWVFFFVYLFSFLLLIVISLRRTLFCRQLSYSLHCFSAFRRLPLLIAFIYSLLRAFICFGLLSLSFFSSFYFFQVELLRCDQ